MIPAAELKRLREIAEKATQGKWVAGELGPWGGQGYYIDTADPNEDIENGQGGSFLCVQKVSTETASNNAKHIEAFNPQTALALLAEIERLQAALEHYARGAEVIGFDRGERAREALKTP